MSPAWSSAGIHPTNVPFAGRAGRHRATCWPTTTVHDPAGSKSVTAVGVSAGSTPSAGNLGATLTGLYGTLVLGGDGNYVYPTLNNANSATNALAQGQHADDVFTYSMSDPQGHVSTTTLTIDVLGTDDQPAVAGSDKTETAATIVETPLTTGDATPHVQTGTIHFTDVDLTDRPTATVSTQTACVTYTATVGDEGHDGALTLTPAQLTAIEQAFTVATAPGSTNNGAVDWTYSIADNALDFLAQGETVTLVSTVLLDDHNGGTDTATVTLTIHGSNDLIRHPSPMSRWRRGQQGFHGAGRDTERNRQWRFRDR